MTRLMGNQKPVAIVTGAAGGIGTAVAGLLARKNYCVVLSDINEPGLLRLQESLGREHLICHGDITDRAQIDLMIRYVMEEKGRVDLLVNNAGMVVTEPFIDCPVETLAKEADLNYLSVLYCTKAVLPHMREAGKGTIVSVASLAGMMPLAASPGYAASKFAIRGLMLSLNLALKEYGIHAGCVCPSAVDTPMLQEEAVTGGSALNFLQTPQTSEDVARAVWKVVEKRKVEVCVPAHEGISCKLAGFFPSVLPGVLPWLEQMGERNREKYIQRKAL